MPVSSPRAIAVLILIAASSACVELNTAFECQNDQQCARPGQDSRCEPETGYCSFADHSCPGTARRYGGLAGAFSNLCVDEINGDGGPDRRVPDGGDAPLDTRPDGRSDQGLDAVEDRG